MTTHFYYELRFMKIDLPEQYADKMPRFVGGEGALVAYIRQNLKYPKEAEERKIEGRVLVRFVVSKTGKIGDIQVLKGVGYHPLDAEAYRIVKDMPIGNRDYLKENRHRSILHCLLFTALESLESRL